MKVLEIEALTSKIVLEICLKLFLEYLNAYKAVEEGSKLEKPVQGLRKRGQKGVYKGTQEATGLLFLLKAIKIFFKDLECAIDVIFYRSDLGYKKKV